MGEFTYPDGIAVAQLIFFTLSLIAGIPVIMKHGMSKSSGWVFLVVLSLMRMVGSIARLVTISNPSDTANTIAIICSVLGLSPLLMASLGLLSRAYESINRHTDRRSLPGLVIKVTHLINTVALILCIVAANKTDNVTEIYDEDDIKIALGLYVVTMVVLTLLTLGACIVRNKTGDGEGLVVLVVLCALPFLWVRLIYSLLSAFSHWDTFKTFSGLNRAYDAELCMAVLEEMIVVAIYLAAGLKLKALPKEKPSDPRYATANDARRGGGAAGKPESNGYGYSEDRGPAPFRLRRVGLFGLVSSLFETVRDRREGQPALEPYSYQQTSMAENGRSGYSNH